MTNYELVDLSQSFFSNALSAYAVFLSLVSGFLATAYLAGASLTAAQVRLLTTLFLLVMMFLIWTMSAYTYWGVLLVEGARVADDSTSILLPSVWVPVIFALLNLFTAAMCLVFMWNVRHPKQEQV